MNELIILEGDWVVKRLLDINKKKKDGYNFDVLDLINWLKAERLPLDSLSLQRYAEHLKERPVAASTFNKRITGIKNRLREVYKNDAEKSAMLEVELKKIKPIKIVKRSIGEDKILNQDELERLLEMADSRMKLIIQFLNHTGLRVSEAISIRNANVKELDSYFDIRILGKGQKERIIKVQKELIDEIRKEFRGKEYLFETRRNGKYMRGYISSEIRILGIKALHRSISAHSMRHTFVTRMIKKTRNIQGVSEYVGHSSIAVTLQLYSHEPLSLKDLDIV